MILFDAFLQLNESELFVNTFFVVIQFGSILAVIFLYFRKLNPFSRSKDLVARHETINLWKKVIVAIIPAAILGLLFDDTIDAMFYNPVTVAVMLIVYGILFIVIENRHRFPYYRNLEQLDYKTAFLIGCFQSLALIPAHPVPALPLWVRCCWVLPGRWQQSFHFLWPFPPCWVPVH